MSNIVRLPKECIRIPNENKPHIWLDPTLGWNFCYSSTIWKIAKSDALIAFTKYMDQQRVKC